MTNANTTAAPAARQTPAALAFEGVSFAYPAPEGASGPAAEARPVLDGCDLSVPEGAFCLLVGDTGSGKTTLLRLAKPEIAPAGSLDGRVLACGRDVRELDGRASAETVGYVFQNPDSQIVCDTVWHEMAFGLENLAVPESQMRRRVAEVSYFFGMEPWFSRPTAELSGGQRQVLALAATLAMRPRVLLLDEPTSMLDPIAEKSFASLLRRVNLELGVTVVVATHAPAPLAPFATMAVEVGEGTVRPVEVAALERRGRLADVARKDGVKPADGPRDADARASVRLRDVWWRYGREEPWVLRGCDLDVSAGEVRAIVGGNASGKSTLLSAVAQISKPQRGRVEVADASCQALLPQSPKALLTAESVEEELMEWSRAVGYGREDVLAAMGELGLAEGLLASHPYDLSGGQQQLVALAKVLLTRPRLLLLDEPTKGLDDAARAAVARAVARVADSGATVLLVTHDLEFVRVCATSVSMIFDGKVISTEPTPEFFETSWLWGVSR